MLLILIFDEKKMTEKKIFFPPHPPKNWRQLRDDNLMIPELSLAVVIF